MSVESRIAQLEGLLGRVQRNASRPRTAAAVVSGVVASPAPVAPVAAAAPAWSSPAPVAPPVVAPAAPVMDEVDELLGADSGMSPEVPVSVELEQPTSEEVFVIEEPAPVTVSVDEISFDDAGFSEEEHPSVRRPEFGGLELVEEAPASSRRPRVASSMDEALAGAAAHLEAPLTPPPESGAELSAGQEVHIPQAPPRPISVLPTTEQLGQTVSLEEGPAADLELDEPLSETEEAYAEEPGHLEAELPAAGAGMFAENLAPPPDAREELERVRLGEVQASVVARPVISTNVIEFVNAAELRQPESFLALVDGSLSLG